MPPALLFEGSHQVRFLHRLPQLFNHNSNKPKSFRPTRLELFFSLLFKSGWPSGLRRQTQGSVPSSVEGFLVSEWRRRFKTHFGHGLLTSSCNIQTHSEEVNVTKDSKMDATESGYVPSCIKVDKASKEELPG